MRVVSPGTIWSSSRPSALSALPTALLVPPQPVASHALTGITMTERTVRSARQIAASALLPLTVAYVPTASTALELSVSPALKTVASAQLQLPALSALMATSWLSIWSRALLAFQTVSCALPPLTARTAPTVTISTDHLAFPVPTTALSATPQTSARNVSMAITSTERLAHFVTPVANPAQQSTTALHVLLDTITMSRPVQNVPAPVQTARML